MKKTILIITAIISFSSLLKSEQIQVTEDMVLKAVQGWCDALLAISKAGMEGKDAKALAIEVLSTAYNYDNGKVLFKPTLAFGKQTFRLTKEGALAYFVGGNPDYPKDTGFALKNWVQAKFDAADVITHGDIGIFMGNVYLTNDKGEQTMVDKTFVFKFNKEGKPVIIVHKSALPYTPPADTELQTQ